MSDIPVHVDPEELETEAGAIESLASNFSSELDDRQTAIENMSWEGRAQEAFTTMFQEARTQMRDVEAQIQSIAQLLRNAKDGMLDHQDQLAAGISNSG